MMFPLFAWLLWLPALSATGDETVQIKVATSETGHIATFAFKLREDTTVHVKSTGMVVPSAMVDGKGTRYYYYGWIIDSATRRPVWHARSREGKSKQWVFEYDDDLKLKKGTYEIYYAAIRDSYNQFTGSKGRKKPKRGKRGFFRKLKPSLSVVVSAAKGQMVGFSTESLIETRLKKVPIALIRAEDNARKSADFELEKRTSLRIYCLGEALVRNGDTHDYGWITNAETGEIVWFMAIREARFAGGVNRNLQVRKQITLPAGRYRAHYISDGTHAYGSWNSMPPDDPFFWGLTIQAIREKDEIKLIEPVKEPEPVLAINKVTGGKHLIRALELRKQVTLRVLCIGEVPKTRGKPVDHGWIVEANTGKIVWAMEKVRTRHAGGRQKNRMVDERLTLPRGTYHVHYQTDRVHNYGAFSQGEPHDKDRYGITLWTIDKKDRGLVRSLKVDASQTPKVLVQIVKVGDHAYREATFELAQDARVRVIALGEGTTEQMSDYAWIEDDRTGNLVWEMKYRKTRHAGGHNKNRLFDGNIGLKKGRYKVLFETDGSHAYGHWNQTPPKDEERYGVTIYLVK